MLYQLMKVREDGEIVQSGKTCKTMKHLTKRLAKMRKGWIQQVNADLTKTVLKVRGFSRETREAITSCGVEVC